MKQRTLFITTAALSFAFMHPCFAAISTNDFINKASTANEFEIESSKLALDKSQNKDIKLFAQHMVTDHTQTGDDLQTIVQSEKAGMKIEDNLDAPHQKLMKRLESESGDAFNNDYVSIQLDAHKEAVHLFGDYAKSGDNGALKTFAQTTLPALEGHLQEIEKIKAKE